MWMSRYTSALHHRVKYTSSSNKWSDYFDESFKNTFNFYQICENHRGRKNRLYMDGKHYAITINLWSGGLWAV